MWQRVESSHSASLALQPVTNKHRNGRPKTDSLELGGFYRLS